MAISESNQPYLQDNSSHMDMAPL